MNPPEYEHTQAGWTVRIAFLAAAALFVFLMAMPELSRTTAPRLVLIVGAALAALIGWAWGSLTVCIQDGQLHLRFGPGWPRKTVPLAEIAAAEVTRTTLLDGWGIHRTRRGWVYNVSGFDAVLLRLTNGKTLLLGTDEPRQLQAAIEHAQARTRVRRAR